jgi:cysteine desulfurase/selenocysteine lyase
MRFRSSPAGAPGRAAAGGGAEGGRPGWEEVRGWVPALRRWAYLNAAACSPLPEPVVEALRCFLERWRDDDITPETGLDHAEGVRGKVAAFLGCGRDEIAFTGSTTEGLLRVAEALDWRPGDNVVVPRGSFPAVVYPWFPLREDGVEVRLVGDGRSWVGEEELLGAMDGSTRLLAVSWVCFCTGHRYDLRLLGEACRRAGALLCVDAIQGAGAVRLDLASLPVDFLAFQPVKWIPSISGLGIFYCRRDLLPALRTRHLGWTSAERTGLDCLTDYSMPPWPSARRYEGGSVPPLQAVSLGAALGLFEEVGLERIEARVLRLGALLAAGLRARGYRVRTPEEDGRRAGITTFEVRRPDEAAERLRAAGVVVAVREGCLRASTHFYNDEGEVERLLESLPPP